MTLVRYCRRRDCRARCQMKGMRLKPPSMHELLDDPVYRRYVKTVPLLALNLRSGQPWAVWARLASGPWRGANVATYRDAWAIVVKAVRSAKYEDVAVVSRRQLFNPPEGFAWDWSLDWCSRCRRPTSFAIRPRHHALRNAPALTTDDPYRCYYCGARRCFAGRN